MCEDKKRTGGGEEQEGLHSGRSLSFQKGPGMIQWKQRLRMSWVNREGLLHKPENTKSTKTVREWKSKKSVQDKQEKAALLLQGSEDDTDKASCEVKREPCFPQGLTAAVKRQTTPLWRTTAFLPVCPLTCFAMSASMNKDYWGHSIAKLCWAPVSTQSQINPLLLLIRPQTRHPTKN